MNDIPFQKSHLGWVYHLFDCGHYEINRAGGAVWIHVDNGGGSMRLARICAEENPRCSSRTVPSYRAVTGRPGPLEEIAQLLQAGEMPLGFIARLREGAGEPFVDAWVDQNPTGVGELSKSELFDFGHRLATGRKWPESTRGRREKRFGDIDVG